MQHYTLSGHTLHYQYTLLSAVHATAISDWIIIKFFLVLIENLHLWSEGTNILPFSVNTWFLWHDYEKKKKNIHYFVTSQRFIGLYFSDKRLCMSMWHHEIIRLHFIYLVLWYRSYIYTRRQSSGSLRPTTRDGGDFKKNKTVIQ